jgi:hypothetical protein
MELPPEDKQRIEDEERRRLAETQYRRDVRTKLPEPSSKADTKNPRKLWAYSILSLLLLVLILFLVKRWVSHPSTMTPAMIFDVNSGSVVLLENYNDDNQLVATGSGFCVGDSLIATNYHVVRGATRLVAKGKDSTRYDGSEIESYDLVHDLAIVKFNSLHLKPLPLADSTALKRGDHVTAIGSPLAIQNTLSDGIVTNLLFINGFDIIQISAPISHGSSGGPLFDDHGAVLGITAAINPNGELVNFAVSSAHLQQLLDHPAPVGFSDFLAQTRVVLPVVSGSTMVPHRMATQFKFTVPPNRTAVIEGTVNISGGFGNDIAWRLDQVPSGGQPIPVTPMASCSSQCAIKQSLQAGDYALFFDNGSSPIFGRTITGDVSLKYFR